MKVVLCHRHYGLHTFLSETEIPGRFGDYATPAADPDSRDDFVIHETSLLAALPDGFLPVPADRVLIMVEREDWGTGQVDLRVFRNWGKYFDSHVLNLIILEEKP